MALVAGCGVSVFSLFSVNSSSSYPPNAVAISSSRIVVSLKILPLRGDDLLRRVISKRSGSVGFLLDGRVFVRGEWERSRGHEQTIREVIERGLHDRRGASSDSVEANSDEFALLRELEKRLKMERKADTSSTGEEVEGEGCYDTKVDESGPVDRSIPVVLSTYELMSELEKRLRAERERRRESGDTERRRQREHLKAGDDGSLHRNRRGMRKESSKLEKLLETECRPGGTSSKEFRGSRREQQLNTNRKSSKENSHQDFARVDAAAGKSNPKTEAEGTQQDVTATPKYPQSNGTVAYLRNEANGAEIFLVGTSHVSQKSADEVREVIKRVKPDIVMVELCQKRYEDMKHLTDQDKGHRDINMLGFIDKMIEMAMRGDMGAMGKLIGVCLVGFFRLLLHPRFHPGQEFQVAIEEGRNVEAKIVLGDQDIDTTMKHLGKFNLNMSLEDTFKFFGRPVPNAFTDPSGGDDTSNEDMLERIRDRKVIRRFNEEMEKGAPVVSKVLVKERNEVMIKTLCNLEGRIVVVVGLAHMDGMEQLLQEVNEKYFLGQ